MIKLFIQRLLIVSLMVSLSGTLLNQEVRANSKQIQNGSKKDQWQTTTNWNHPPEGFKIISSTPTSLVLDIQIPVYHFETSTVEGQSCKLIFADGYYPTSPPGEPGVLSTGIMLGIPLDSIPSITILTMEMINLPGRIHLCPVGMLLIQRDRSGNLFEQKNILSKNASSYSQDTFKPSQPVKLSVSGMIRSQRVARLEFTPFQYNPSHEALRIVHHIKVELHFNVTHALSSPVDEGFFESMLRNILVNYNEAQLWRYPPQSQLTNPTISPINLLDEQPDYKIQVDQDGIYQVTYSALQVAGVPVDDLNPRTFKLFNQGTEIPIIVVGEEDNVFDLQDYLLFYGQKITMKYTNSNIYWLSWGDINGLRMSAQDGTVQGADMPISFRTVKHLEEDELYLNEAPSGPEFDHWYWYFLNAYSAPVTQDIPFYILNLDPSSATATVSGLLKGYYAEPQHHTIISLNGNIIADHVWPSEGEYAFTIDVPVSYLLEGNNILTFTLPHDGDIQFDYQLVNWFEVEYEHTYSAENDQLDFNKSGQWQFQVKEFSSDTIDVFEITNPSDPIRILGGSIIPNDPFFQINFEQKNSGDHRYLLLSPTRWLTPVSITLDNPSSLKNPANEADYIIITHADFMAAIQPLAAYRTNQGMRVKVVDIQDMYDEFAAGIFDPQAIQDFLAYTYDQWLAPSPSYVLLVGDGHYDFKDNYGDSGANYIPPYLGEFDPWIGETVSDNRYVTISGDDILPDMYIGRLPVSSVFEVTAMLDKILYYEQNPLQGWNSKLTFVADNADAGGNFPMFSDNIASNFVPNEYAVEKIYYGLPPYENPAVAKAAILNAINEGSLIINYNGHASLQNWASEGLFGVNSIGNLSNSGKFPLFLPLTCQEGYFIWPNFSSLAESVVRANDKGAIASFSPSGFGLSNGHDLLAQSLYHAFFSHGLTQLGPAVTFAKYYLDVYGKNYSDLIDTYNLLGDPAVRLKTLPFSIHIPLVVR